MRNSSFLGFKKSRDSYSREDQMSPKNKRILSYRSTSSPRKSEKEEILKFGWLRDLQKEAILTKYTPMKISDSFQIEPSTQEESNSLVKKRGIEFLKEEFKKADSKF